MRLLLLLEIRCRVAPYMGAWIEIACPPGQCWPRPVAPYMGAWIEINKAGLPFAYRIVAPYMGAWIEISRSRRIT